MEEKNNLPVESKQNKLIAQVKDRLPEITDKIKRIGKITGFATLALASVATSAMLSTLPALLGTGAVITNVAGVASFGTFIGALTAAVNAGKNAIYKHEPGLAFVTRKNSKHEVTISQDSLTIPSYMKGLDSMEKGELMGLQTLIGFQRSKVNLRGTDYTIDENGNRVYNQEITTTTHGINLKNLRALETLGYIKIDSIEPSKIGPFKKLIGQEYLFIERIGFGEIKGLRNILEELRAIHNGTTTADKKEFETIRFRLTDKDIDFEELYRRMNSPESRTRGKKAGEPVTPEKMAETSAFRRIGLMFYGKNSRRPGILALSNEGRKEPVQVIDIEYDKYNRPFLVYGAKQSFSDRMEEKMKLERVLAEQSKTLDETLRVENVPEVTINPNHTTEDRSNETEKGTREDDL